MTTKSKKRKKWRSYVDILGEVAIIFVLRIPSFFISFIWDAQRTQGRRWLAHAFSSLLISFLGNVRRCRLLNTAKSRSNRVTGRCSGHTDANPTKCNKGITGGIEKQA